jgi:hypothetical protein
MATIQIYNAVRQEKLSSKAWLDIDFALASYGDPAIFMGSRPTSLGEYPSLFGLGMGYSTQNLARGGARPSPRPVESKSSCIQAQTVTPVANMLRPIDDPGWSAPDIELLLANARS